MDNSRSSNNFGIISINNIEDRLKRYKVDQYGDCEIAYIRRRVKSENNKVKIEERFAILFSINSIKKDKFPFNKYLGVKPKVQPKWLEISQLEEIIREWKLTGQRVEVEFTIEGAEEIYVIIK